MIGRRFALEILRSGHVFPALLMTPLVKSQFASLV